MSAPSLDTYPTSGLEDEQPTRHHKYYAQPHVVLQVENILYKVDRSLFRTSTYFRDILGRNDARGASDDDPLVLQAIRSSEFDSFLDVLTSRSLNDVLSHLTAEQWESVLKLSHLWGFPDVSRFALEKLDKILGDDQSFHRIRLGMAHNLDPQTWLQQPYVFLCTRTKPFSLEEASVVNLPVFLALSEVREATYRDALGKMGIIKALRGHPVLGISALNTDSEPTREGFLIRKVSVIREKYFGTWLD